MTTAEVYAGTLLAVDADARTLRYRLVRYGEQGSTNLGRVRIRAGALRLPDPGALVANLEHERTAPVARATAITDDGEQLTAAFHVLPTSRGDDLLAEAAAGVRTGASVELDDLRIRAGWVEAGTLTGVGFVVAPAFPSSRLVATQAPDTDDPAGDPPDGDDDDAGESGADNETERDPMPDTDAATLEADPAPDDTLNASRMTAAALTSGAHTTGRAPATAHDAFTLLAAAGAGTFDSMGPQLRAALTDITYTANALTQPPQWIGELWSGTPYERQIVPLIGHDNLTALMINGWRWTTRPEMAEYAGDKLNVPSNVVGTEAVQKKATRYAGAHDVDRALIDFGDAAFWSGYWTAMAASYARLTDGAVADALLAEGTAGTAETLASAVMLGALEVNDLGPVSFVLISRDLVAAQADVTIADQSAFLNKLGLNIALGGDLAPIAFRSWKALPASTVIVGTRNAATFYELAGATPLRVGPVENIGQGGVDVGAFGYGGVIVHDPAGIQVMTVGPAIPPGRSAAKS